MCWLTAGPIRARFDDTSITYALCIFFPFKSKQKNPMTTQTAKAIRIDQPGGPEQLKLVDVQVGEPGPGEIRIRHKAVGLNYIDVYQRSGMYPFAMPLQLGMEASGVVEAVGDGVTHLAVGDRAAYASAPPGSYCELIQPYTACFGWLVYRDKPKD